jgi:large subunit ribosomal protein L14
VILADRVKKEPKAGRVFGPIPRELSLTGIEGYKKIASLAPEIV